MPAEAATQRAEAIRAALGAAPEAPAALQDEIVRGVIGEPDQRTRSVLWILLVAGLLALLGVTLWGIVDTITDNKNTTSPDKLITIFTAVLTGLIGLFAPSPIARRR